jgi:hypothetical protein
MLTSRLCGVDDRSALTWWHIFDASAASSGGGVSIKILSRPRAYSMARFMFRCELCSRVVPPRTPAQHVVLESRSKVYPLRVKANRLVRRPPKGKPLVVFTSDPGGTGREIVKEAIACPECARGCSAS